jgi:hypothetical protein
LFITGPVSELENWYLEASRARSGIRCCHPNGRKDARLEAYGLRQTGVA